MNSAAGLSREEALIHDSNLMLAFSGLSPRFEDWWRRIKMTEHSLIGDGLPLTLNREQKLDIGLNLSSL